MDGESIQASRRGRSARPVAAKSCCCRDFQRAYESRKPDADALRVLVAAGPRPITKLPMAAGSYVRAHLSLGGLVDHASSELEPVVRPRPFAARGGPIVGLEPSCLLTLARLAGGG